MLLMDSGVSRISLRGGGGGGEGGHFFLENGITINETTPSTRTKSQPFPKKIPTPCEKFTIPPEKISTRPLPLKIFQPSLNISQHPLKISQPP